MVRAASVQLYTLREECAADLDRVLAQVAELGYAGVELAGLHGRSPRAFADAVGKAGLAISAAHVPLPDDPGLHDAVLDAQEELGVCDLIVPMLHEGELPDRASLDAGTSAMNALAEAAAARGLRVGYHNHEWEFTRRIDGRSAYDLLFEGFAPEIFAELDVYWAAVGKADPARTIRELGDRCRHLHLKDGPACDASELMCALGEGALDIAGCVEAAAGASWLTVEIDRCAGSTIDALDRSLRYLRRRGLIGPKGEGS